MGLLDKINKWRGIYDESIIPEQEFAVFPLSFSSFEDFADPFARSMSMEIFKAKNEEKSIEDGVPYVLWGDRPASDEYVYIYRTDVLTEEKLERFEAEQNAFVESLEKSPKTVIITLICVEESSEAYECYCRRMPRNDGYELCELVCGIAFDKREMNTGILVNCVDEKNHRSFRKEFLRMIRVAENYFKG